MNFAFVLPGYVLPFSYTALAAMDGGINTVAGDLLGAPRSADVVGFVVCDGLCIGRLSSYEVEPGTLLWDFNPSL